MLDISQCEGRLKEPDACIQEHLNATTIGKTRLCDYLASRQKGLEPMEQLPPGYVLAYKLKMPYVRPPRLYFGLDITCDTLCAYAVEHRLHQAELAETHKQRYACMLKVVEHLSRLCGADLSLQALLWSPEDEWMIARYSNYNPFSYINKGPPDEEVFAVISRELSVTSVPKWYQAI